MAHGEAMTITEQHTHPRPTRSTATAVNPWTWQEPLGFAQAVSVDHPTAVLTCAGQASVDAEGAVVHADDMAGQLAQALDNIDQLLEAGGFERTDVVRVTIFVTDIGAYYGAQHVFIDHFAGRGIPVAASLIGVTGLALPGLMVELEATAIR